MTVARAALLLGAGALAGIVGSAGGTASLISYPALLAIGLPPLPANITNAVAFVAAWPGSALGSRPELRGQGPWLLRWAPLTAAGSAAGAGLLLVTPAAAFDRLLLPGGLLASAAYDGYWGAGAGVMTLALLMIATGQQPARCNALKNMLLGIADVSCCIVFIACWRVDWAAAAPMAAGFLGGSMIGPALTRRMPGNVLRILAALAGLALAVRLWAGS
jgi:hypothetical protein